MIFDIRKSFEKDAEKLPVLERNCLALVIEKFLQIFSLTFAERIILR